MNISQDMLYQSITASIAAGIVVHDRKGLVMFANAYAERLLGIESQSLSDATWFGADLQFLRPDETNADIQELPPHITARTGTPTQNVRLGVQKNARDVSWIRFHSSILSHPNLPDDALILTTLTDVTEEVATKDALRDAKTKLDDVNLRLVDESKRLSGILETAMVGIVSINKSGNIEVFNREASRMFGYPANQLLGRHINELVPADKREIHLSHIDGFRKHGPSQLPMGQWRDVRGLRADGTTFPIKVVLSRIELTSETVSTAIISDMTDIMATEGELQKSLRDLRLALQTAEEASEAQTRFLANMSHELRTPLNAIIGFSEMLVKKDMADFFADRRSEYLSAIHDSGMHLLDLINDVLDLTKIESNAFELNPEPLDIAAILNECERMINPAATSRQISIRASSEERLHAYCDHRALRQCLLNILSNAVKYSPVGSIVTVATKADGNTIRISVKDQGPGIPQDIIERVGEPFLRSTNPIMASVEGTGLGLAITTHLIKAQHGEMLISSELGKGADVTLIVPMHIPA